MSYKIYGMKSKIFKYELFVLFVFTIISFIAYYYYDSMPDNYFSIDSSSESTNYLVYLFSTFMATIGNFLGPWIFLPFFLSAFFYTFCYSKRTAAIDIFAPILFILFFFTLSYFFFPEFLGEGSLYLLNNYISKMVIFISLVFSLILILMINFKDVSFPQFRRPSLSNNFLQVKKPNAKFSFQFKEKLKEKYHFLKQKALINKQLLQETKDNFFSLMRKKSAPSPHSPVEKNSAAMGAFFRAPINIVSSKNIEEKEVITPKIPSPPSTHKILLEKKSSVASEYFDTISRFPLQRRVQENKTPEHQYFERIVGLIEDKMAEFNIDGKIVNILKGPVVDTYELELGQGVKVSKIRSISEDLSLALFGAPIRIVYQMKGRSTMGIEVPRSPRQVIFLDEVLESAEFKSNSFKLPIAMGKNAFGEIFITDLTKMPHMLVAGATGAGKSVFINTVLMSLLVKCSPDKLKLILIDPKQLELALYSSLPHLVMPVITDSKMASISLLWAVEEMERRYSILKDFGVRNIEGHNLKVKHAGPEDLGMIHHHFENADDEGYELPYLIIVIDEFADLILTRHGKEVESNVCRLAAKARAAGIHLIVATQRPSVDVITGLIKSNFPTRVSFRVTSSVDSRTILNAIGAENLLGQGDMLFKHGIETTRAHSSYVNEEEIEVFMETLSSFSCNYDSSAIEFIENGGENPSYSKDLQPNSSQGKGEDELYDEAVRIVCEGGSASASMLQRKLRIGYNRAANLIEELETKGVVGPAIGARPREVLISNNSDTL